MEARLAPLVLALAALSSMGASHRTRNFVVSASNPQWAAQVAENAEQLRRDLAIEWLGKELPAWRHPCPIRVQDGPRELARGETSFAFVSGVPVDWRMKVYGTRQRILDSVLPHEITHTVFATHFGQPLPRWADEGACTTVEHASERAKQHELLIRFLKTGRGIAFNRLFTMRQYPRDILPLYSQGYSLARYLIAQGGKRKFIAFVGRGLNTSDWNGATREFYGFKDLSQLQLTWNAWVAKGSPSLPDGSGSVASTSILLQSPDPEPDSAGPRSRSENAGRVRPVAATAAAAGESWYIRQARIAGGVRRKEPAPATRLQR